MAKKGKYIISKYFNKVNSKVYLSTIAGIYESGTNLPIMLIGKRKKILSKIHKEVMSVHIGKIIWNLVDAVEDLICAWEALFYETIRKA